jgi:hypothetical protein
MLVDYHAHFWGMKNVTQFFLKKIPLCDLYEWVPLTLVSFLKLSSETIFSAQFNLTILVYISIFLRIFNGPSSS